MKDNVFASHAEGAAQRWLEIFAPVLLYIVRFAHS